MNIIDIIILVIIGVNLIFGLYRGFISGLLSLAALLLSIILAFSFSDNLATMLLKNETLVDTISYYTDDGSRIYNADVSGLTLSDVTESTVTEVLEELNLPRVFENTFLETIKNNKGNETLQTVLNETILNISISIISFLICFFVSYVVLSLLSYMIVYVFDLPILRHLDSLIGGIFGVIKGIIIVYILYSIIPLIETFVPVEQVTQAINASYFAPFFDSNMIIKIFQNALY